MKEIKNSAYRSAWVPDHCNDLGIEVYNADNWQDNLLHNVLRVVHKQRRGVAIDGGANVGMTAIALRYYFDCVVAFEADPLNYECFLKNTDFLTNIHSYNFALSDQAGEQAIFARKIGVSGHSRRSNGEIEDPNYELFNVDTTTIDSITYPGRINFIKLDVEGSEFITLKGAQNILKMDRPVLLIEIDKGSILKFDLIYQYLISMDYIFLDKIKRDFLFIPKENYRDSVDYFRKQRVDNYMPHIRAK